MEVGTGDPFSSLDTQPTGFELATIITGLDSYFVTAEEFPFGSEVTKDCPSGGTFTENVQVSETENGATLTGDVSVSACSVSFFIDGQAREESLTGTIHVRSDLTQTDEIVQFSVALSVSGDLGFSMECDVQFRHSNTDFSHTGSGQCVFHDQEGTTVTVSGDELVGLRSQTPII